MSSDKTIIIGSNLNGSSVGKQFLALSDKLAEEKYNIIFISQTRIRPEKQKEHPNVNFVEWPNNRPTTLKDFIFYFKLVLKLKPLITISNFGATNIMLIVGWILRCPIRIVWYHTLFDYRMVKDSDKKKINFKTLRKRLIYKFATHLVPVSNAALKDVIQNYKVEPLKCNVIYNSIAMPQEVKRNFEKKIICLGRLIYSKGQDVFIKAAEIVLEKIPDFTFEIVGGGNMRNTYEKLIKESKYPDRIILKSEVDTDKVFELFKTSYASVVPSRHEAFGLVVIESMSVGTPVVATNSGGIPEIIDDGKDGFLVEQENFKEMADKILYLIENPETRTTMSNNARHKFLTKFEQNAVTQKQVDWLNNLIHNN